jgi:hypothetical protein
MTPTEVTAARLKIGLDMGLMRPLHKNEMGHLLGYNGRDPGSIVRIWEQGKGNVSRPAALLIQALLDGWRPEGWEGVIRGRRSL